jgi:hypothetical protein
MDTVEILALSRHLFLLQNKIVNFKYKALGDKYIGFDTDCKKIVAYVVESGKKDI